MTFNSEPEMDPELAALVAGMNEDELVGFAEFIEAVMIVIQYREFAAAAPSFYRRHSFPEPPSDPQAN